MFSVLYMFFAKWFDKIIRYMQVSGNMLSYFISSGIAVAVAFMAGATSVIHWVIKLFRYLCYYIDQLKMPDSISGGLAGYTLFWDTFKLINTFFPLDTLFILCMAYASLAFICSLIGMIKSLIGMLFRVAR